MCVCVVLGMWAESLYMIGLKRRSICLSARRGCQLALMEVLLTKLSRPQLTHRLSVFTTSSPLIHSGTSSLPHVGTSSLPHIGTSSLPHVGTSSLPHSGTSSLPHSGTSSLPHSGTSSLPHVGTSSLPHVGTSSQSDKSLLRVYLHTNYCTSM